MDGESLDETLVISILIKGEVHEVEIEKRRLLLSSRVVIDTDNETIYLRVRKSHLCDQCVSELNEQLHLEILEKTLGEKGTQCTHKN